MQLRYYVFVGSVLLILLAQPLRAAIIVNSQVDPSQAIRAQAVISNPDALGTGGPTAVAIKEFRATIIIRDDVSPPSEGDSNALLVTKHNLTNLEAWGSGAPNGYGMVPTFDPGPWQGLVWPYRDQYDWFKQPSDPLADDVGTSFFDPPDVYGFINIVGIARGGPTEPGIPTPGMPTPAWLNRGITGNGLPVGLGGTGPATYFEFDISSLSGQPDRFVRLQIIAASAVVAVQDGTNYFEQTVAVADQMNIFIQLPEPATALSGTTMLSLLALRRRRVE